MAARASRLKLRSRPVAPTAISSDSRGSSRSAIRGFATGTTKGCRNQPKKHNDKRTTTNPFAAVGRAVATKVGNCYEQLPPFLRLITVASSVFIIFGTIMTVVDSSFYSFGIEVTSASKNATKSFAVVINTYRRPDRLRDAVVHYAATCGMKYRVEQVFVVWSELKVDPPSVDEFFVRDAATFAATDQTRIRGGRPLLNNDAISVPKSEVAIIRVEKDSLNSRFLPIKGLKTDAIFMVDDDVRVDCKSLSDGFEAWRSYPSAMVGYYPRLASPPLFTGSSAGGGSGQLVYHTWPIVYLRGTFNMVLTKACFLHSKYLELYSGDSHPQEIRDYVDRHKNCEDVAMSLLVANATMSEPPLYVEGSVTDTGLFGGISTGTGHMLTRSDCLTDLSRIYARYGRRVPLADVQLWERSWLRHYPGFRWQIRPSSFFEWLSFGNVLS